MFNKILLKLPSHHGEISVMNRLKNDHQNHRTLYPLTGLVE